MPHWPTRHEGVFRATAPVHSATCIAPKISLSRRAPDDRSRWVDGRVYAAAHAVCARVSCRHDCIASNSATADAGHRPVFTDVVFALVPRMARRDGGLAHGQAAGMDRADAHASDRTGVDESRSPRRCAERARGAESACRATAGNRRGNPLARHRLTRRRATAQLCVRAESAGCECGRGGACAPVSHFRNIAAASVSRVAFRMRVSRTDTAAMREIDSTPQVRLHHDALSTLQAIGIVLVCAVIVGVGSMVLPIG
jgi:hypothetical protein